MNNPNPFVPKGSLLEQQSVRRSRLKIAVGCAVLVSVTGLMVMLIQGCKRDQPQDNPPVPPADTNPPAVSAGSLNAAPDLTSTNPLTANASNPASAMATSPLPSTPPPMTNPNPAPATTPTTSPAVTEPTAGTEYVVASGDTLAKIAKANGVSLKALKAANPNVDPKKLKVKQKLIIPGKTAESTTAAGTGTTPTTDASATSASGATYKVKSGDTLTRIAKRNGVSVKALRAANSLTTDHLKVGQKLTIPAKAEAAAPAATVTPAPDATATPVPAAAPAAAPTSAAPTPGH
jgi:LysM repeat protein